MSRRRAYQAWFLLAALFLAADGLIISSSATLTRLARKEIDRIFGDTLQIGDLTVSLAGGVDARHVALLVTKDRHKVLSADRVQIRFGLDEGRIVPEEVALTGARFSFSDRLMDSADLGAGGGPDLSALKSLPRIIVRGGAIEIAHSQILAWDQPQVLTIERIAMVPVEGARYFVGADVHGPRFGAWRVSGGFDLATGSHEVTASCEETTLGPDIRSILAPQVRPIFDRYKPGGTARMRLHFFRPAGAAPTFTAAVQPIDMSIEYEHFPYRVDDVAGEIEFAADGFVIKHVTGRSGPMTVDFDGRCGGYASGAPIHFRFDVKGMPIDDKLRNALKPVSRKVVDRFSPKGSVDVSGLILREAGPGKPVRNPLDITFRDASFRYEGFPYEIDGVEGEIRVDGDDVTVKTLRGRHGAAAVSAHGTLEDLDHEGGVIDLHIAGTGVPIDLDLKQALPPHVRSLWEEFQPSGSADVEWRVHKERGAAERQTGIIAAKGGRIVYRQIPLPVAGITGLIHVEPGSIRLDHLHGTLDNGEVDLNGLWSAKPEGYQLDLEVDHRGAVVDERFKKAMPKSISNLLTTLKVTGLADYRFTMKMTETGGINTIDLWAIDLNLSKGLIEAALRIEDIEGEARMSGVVRDGKPQARGSLSLRQARFKKKLATDITSGFYVDGTKVTFESIRARSYRGIVEGVFWIDGETTELGGEFTADRLEVRDYVRDTARYADRNLSGKMNVSIRNLTGKGNDLHSLKGEGSMVITEGQLLEVPGVVNLLSMKSGGRFKAARADYVLERGKFRVNSPNVLAFEAESGAVYAQGWMDFDLNYKLKATSETASFLGIDFWLFKIPSLLFDALKTPFKKVVTGSLLSDDVDVETDPEKMKKFDEDP